MNLGPVWANLLIVIVGALLAGVPLTAVNVFLLAVLFLLWQAVSHLPGEDLRRPLYVVLVTTTLALMFAVPATPPAFVLLLPAWAYPYGWLAVAGGVISGITVDFAVLRGQETWLRSSAVAIVAVYFLAVLTALVAIQTELSQV